MRVNKNSLIFVYFYDVKVYLLQNKQDDLSKALKEKIYLYFLYK